MDPFFKRIIGETGSAMIGVIVIVIIYLIVYIITGETQ